MSPTELAAWLQTLGLPESKALEMAGQLDRRARQLADREGRSHAEALAHLLNLMQQGWAANERNPERPA